MPPVQPPIITIILNNQRLNLNFDSCAAYYCFRLVTLTGGSIRERQGPGVVMTAEGLLDALENFRVPCNYPQLS